MRLKWKVENWVFMQTLIMNTSLFTSGTLTRTHFLWMGDCFDSILREQFFFAIRIQDGTVLTGNLCSRFLESSRSYIFILENKTQTLCHNQCIHYIVSTMK